ncbi:MAG TPA: type II CAAX endopeptidase family protein [Thermoanaerobaculia bacterium]|nr:type II CAAX endopeptidase family protein [Thermoanaerobaculia bacterium]
MKRAAIDRALAPALAFLALYLGALALVLALVPPRGPAAAQWSALSAAIFATIAAPLLIERRLDAVGLGSGPRRALRDLIGGFGIACAVAGSGALLIAAASGLEVVRGSGIRWMEVGAIMVPAALHEEVVFRGYAFQRLARWSMAGAIAAGSVPFAALHLGNRAVGPIAVANIALAGVLLGLAYFAFRSLWAPIGIHFGWNFVSGPLLGHEVSGWRPGGSLLATIDPGPAWLTGGEFGIEGSILVLVPLAVAIAGLRLRVRNGPPERGVNTIGASASSEREPS